jgi:hypothetical protein
MRNAAAAGPAAIAAAGVLLERTQAHAYLLQLPCTAPQLSLVLCSLPLQLCCHDLKAGRQHCCISLLSTARSLPQ